MTRSETVGISAATIIVTVGLTLGLVCDGMYFSRSGALLVVVAVILGMLGLPQKLSEISNWFNDQIENARANAFAVLASEGKDLVKIQEAVNSAISQTRRELEHEVEKRRKQAVLTEGLMLILGTLIWGFGDLVHVVCQC